MNKFCLELFVRTITECGRNKMTHKTYDSIGAVLNSNPTFLDWYRYFNKNKVCGVKLVL